MDDQHLVYILQSLKDGSFYTGYTAFLILRFREHQEGRSSHTSKHIPWVVVYTETYTTKQDALKREKHIKKMKSKKYIQTLIDRQNELLAKG